MKKSNVIFRFLLPTDQNPTEPIQPAMAAFHHPAAGAAAGLMLEFSSFVTTRAEVCRQAKVSQEIAHLLIVLARIQT